MLLLRFTRLLHCTRNAKEQGRTASFHAKTAKEQRRKALEIRVVPAMVNFYGVFG